MQENVVHMKMGYEIVLIHSFVLLACAIYVYLRFVYLIFSGVVTKTKVPAICLSAADGQLWFSCYAANLKEEVFLCIRRNIRGLKWVPQSELHTKQDKHNNVSALVLCVCVDLKCRLILEGTIITSPPVSLSRTLFCLIPAGFLSSGDRKPQNNS